MSFLRDFRWLTLEQKIAIFFIFIFLYLFVVGFYFFASANSEIFTLDVDNIDLMKNAFNALVMMIIPFVFGSMASIGRILISDLSLLKNIKIVIASGIMASFSWIGIKSKILFALLTPYLSDVARSNDLKKLTLDQSFIQCY